MKQFLVSGVRLAQKREQPALDWELYIGAICDTILSSFKAPPKVANCFLIKRLEKSLITLCAHFRQSLQNLSLGAGLLGGLQAMQGCHLDVEISNPASAPPRLRELL
jgi:hypothetical protein